MLRRHKFVIRTICIAGLLGLLVFAVDLAEAWRSLRAADPFLVVLALGLVQGQIVLSAVRWRFTAGRLGHHLGYGTAVAEYYLASLLNLALPGGVGGDAVRAARAGAARPVGSAVTGPVILRAVVLERLAGQMAFLLLATIGIALWPALIDGEAPAGWSFCRLRSSPCWRVSPRSSLASVLNRRASGSRASVPMSWRHGSARAHGWSREA
jgi:glycosyltransferase 2 family protein